ncbi:MAG: hypothetical protein HN975_02170, partial [Anaerolineae bacterium]|nr:hypothetical protein [Anaerolineae bacterium]
MVAWIILSPAVGGFNMAIHPDYFDQLQGDFLSQVEQHQRQVEQKYGLEDKPFGLSVFASDTETIAWVEQSGYVKEKHMYTLTTRSLDDAIPESQLPDGFTIRSAEG